MNLTQQQLEELEGLGELQFSLAECATILQVAPNTFEQGMADNPDFLKAYERGRLKAIAAVRKAIIQQAKQGSTPAQKQMVEIIDKNSKDVQSFHFRFKTKK